MTKLIKYLSKQTRIPPSRWESHQFDRKEIGERCQKIFDKLYPQLKDQYKNWFIAIEPDSEDYLLDSDLITLIKKAQEYYRKTGKRGTIFRINETGTCGKI